MTDLNTDRHEVEIVELADRFGVREMLSDASKDQRFLASLLYYFGILTLNGETTEGKLRLIVPNLVMRSDRLQEMLLPDPVTRDAGVHAGEQVYSL